MTYNELLKGLYGIDNALDYLTIDSEALDALNWITRYARDNRNDIEYVIERESQEPDRTGLIVAYRHGPRHHYTKECGTDCQPVSDDEANDYIATTNWKDNIPEWDNN